MTGRHVGTCWNVQERPICSSHSPKTSATHLHVFIWLFSKCCMVVANKLNFRPIAPNNFVPEVLRLVSEHCKQAAMWHWHCDGFLLVTQPCSPFFFTALLLCIKSCMSAVSSTTFSHGSFDNSFPSPWLGIQLWQCSTGGNMQGSVRSQQITGEDGYL